VKIAWSLVAALAAIVPFRGDPQEVPKASAEYVDSRVCANCHAKIYETYQHTGMARSFYRPSPRNSVEDYRVNNRYYHPASDTHFEMIERDGEYHQRRYQIDLKGTQTNVDEKRIDFILGSGNHVRTYLHQTSTGTLLQLPLAWYADKGGYWAMNPGYDRPDQPNSRRKIYFECMFCHNSYPQVAAGHEQLEAEPHFTGALPEGIDCQRCHGPGGSHVRLAQGGGARVKAISQTIVNPARLAPGRQIEVCMQCHLETDSMQFPHSIVKFDRGPFSYRPGEPLASFILFFDRAPAKPAEDRFQIVNSVYRLKMSACFLKSGGALQCTTCHDPHRVPPATEAARTYSAACLKCHTTAFRRTVDTGRHTASADCIGCHMPKRRTSDVVHAVMTDHFIQRRRPERDLLAELPEPHPETVYHGEVLPYYPKPFDYTPENELYLALAQVREDNNSDAGLDRFRAAIAKYQPRQPEFYVELGDAWVRHVKPQPAVPLYEEALRLKPNSLAALLGLGRALDLAGRWNEAVDAFQRATKVLPDDPVPWRELAQIRLKEGKRTEAVTALANSLKLDAEAPEAHYDLGLAWSLPGGDPIRSEAAFREAIRLAPAYSEAHMNLAILLFQNERVEEAGYLFDSALRYRPNYALGHLNYGLMLLKLNRTREAKRHLQEAAASADPSIRQSALRLLSELAN